MTPAKVVKEQAGVTLCLCETYTEIFNGDVVEVTKVCEMCREKETKYRDYESTLGDGITIYNKEDHHGNVR